MTRSAHPDCGALARIGAAVRTRLADNPAVRRFPGERVEIFAVDGFVSPPDCQRLIRLIDAVACPSCLVDEGKRADYRTSYSGDIDVCDRAVYELDERLERLTGIRPAWGETTQGQRYRCGQYYREHYDWFDTSAAYWQRERLCGGQRSWTAMVYLNGVEEGGATEFPRISLRVPPTAGQLLLWNNALPDGTPNPWTIHAARPVTGGVKYVITKWFRSRISR